MARQLQCPVWLWSSFYSIVSGRTATFLELLYPMFERLVVKIHVPDMERVIRLHELVYATHFGCRISFGFGASVRLTAVSVGALCNCSRVFIYCAFQTGQ